MNAKTIFTIIGLTMALSTKAQKVPDSLTGKKPAAYETVITNKVVSQRGMFTVHKLEDSYYLEIPDSLLNRDILLVNRIAKSAIEGMKNQFAQFAGEKTDERVISFERGLGDKIIMRGKSYPVVSNDSTNNGMYHSLANSTVQPILAAFPVKTNNPIHPAAVIDITSIVNSDDPVFSFAAFYRKLRKIGGQLSDRSYIKYIKAFPGNIEIRTQRTFATLSDYSSDPLTYELNSSLVLLPKVPMRPRFADPRVGYYSNRSVDFDANPQGTKNIDIIKRWRLEPKDEDKERYFRGALVEPKKQIVFYIDPKTPKKWVPYLIQGVNDWQKAFEKAGFKNAIVAKEAPLNDAAWSLEDASHSALIYMPSEEKDATGPSISDPRSGEILESHINWHHNVMSLLHGWYMIQAGAIDPRAGNMKFDDRLMGELIRFVSSHEVGHTLGLAHNYGSSSTVPSEKLRDKVFLETNGHTPSIMDYARFNYVAQPEDHITTRGIYPRIGDYDVWAIEWGYKTFNEKSANAEVALLNKLTVERLKNKRLWFGNESNRDDPRSQSEDLGDNAMISSAYGIKNLQRILGQLPVWTKADNEGYENLNLMYNELTGQLGRYMGHVAKNIGGVMETAKTVDQVGAVYERVSAEKQREAIAFLEKQLFTTPAWLLDKSILDNIGQNPLTVISKLQTRILSRLVSNTTLNKFIAAEAMDGSSAYKVSDFFADMNAAIFAELIGNKEIDVYRRNLQKTYVEKLISLGKPSEANSDSSADNENGHDTPQNDIISIAKGHLKALNASLKHASAKASSLTKYHLEDLSDRIDTALGSRTSL